MLPPHAVEQEALISAFKEAWAKEHFNLERLEELHRSVRVGKRHLAVPLEEYAALDSFGKRNDAWLKAAETLGERAVREALSRAQLSAGALGHLFFVTVTGIATPSIEARLFNRMPISTSAKRSPLFGLGCVAGAAGLARATDYLRAFPDEAALLLSVELCSLTLQREDLSIANIIASGLFADGAAAVVLEGASRAGRGLAPQVVASRSVFYRGTERMMGWDMVDGGFKVVLSAKVPELVRENICNDVDSFLAAQKLSRKDIRHWVAHTGGPKVLDALSGALKLPTDALERSWRSLREVGNLSSASVLFVLGDLMDSGAPEEGDWGVLLAMGPGFCSELLLLKW